MQKAKGKLRRAEMTETYGSKIAGLIPDELSPERQAEFAEKLKAEFPPAQTRTDEGTEPSGEAAVEQPTEQERRAAALSREGTGTPSSGAMSIEDWHKLSVSDPAKAQAVFQAGRVNFTGLREGLGEAK